MENERFDVLIRKSRYGDAEDLYRVTVFRKLEGIDELLLHPEVSAVIGDRVVRVEKIDNFRFKIFVTR